MDNYVKILYLRKNSLAKGGPLSKGPQVTATRIDNDPAPAVRELKTSLLTAPALARPR
jgi:hypothetical protein